MQNRTQQNFLYLIAGIAALGGLLFGYDTAVISGAIGSIQDKFEFGEAWKGWVTASAIWGCVVGVLFAGYLSDRFGRKKVLLGSAVLFAVSAIACALVSAEPSGLNQLILARFIGGLGVGTASMVSPLYISEVSPARNRGRMGTLYQLAIVIGINLIYFINLLIAGLGDEAWNTDTGWRYMLGSETLPALLFFGLIFLLPESPRWLMKQKRESEALDVLERVNGKQKALEVQAEIRDTLQEERGTLAELFQPGLRMATIVGVVLAIFSQITGINAIIYYAPEIFESIGFSKEDSLAQTVAIGVVNTLFTFVAISLIDKAGRRTLLLWGVSGMAFCLLGSGAMFYFEVKGLGLLLFILGFIASFACSMGPIPWVMISEIFPTKNRGMAMSLSIVMLWLAVVLVTQVSPVMMDKENGIGGAYTFWIFMINAILLLIFVWKFVPETKQKTLEEIEKSWRS